MAKTSWTSNRALCDRVEKLYLSIGERPGYLRHFDYEELSKRGIVYKIAPGYAGPNDSVEIALTQDAIRYAIEQTKKQMPFKPPRTWNTSNGDFSPYIGEFVEQFCGKRFTAHDINGFMSDKPEILLSSPLLAFLFNHGYVDKVSGRRGVTYAVTDEACEHVRRSQTALQPALPASAQTE
ncbi:hypothetical protein HYX10_03180 [Candidatus Woesearchaeota archaeon]|nr:hypothetical protein [Candidatus Woesearchaeota archaeon]